MTGSEYESASEKLAETTSDAIVYKSGGISDSRGTKCWRRESLPGGFPAGSTRYEQTLSDSSIHAGMDGFPRVESFIPAGLALDHVGVVGVRAEL